MTIIIDNTITKQSTLVYLLKADRHTNCNTSNYLQPFCLSSYNKIKLDHSKQPLD